MRVQPRHRRIHPAIDRDVDRTQPVRRRLIGHRSIRQDSRCTATFPSGSRAQPPADPSSLELARAAAVESAVSSAGGDCGCRPYAGTAVGRIGQASESALEPEPGADRCLSQKHSLAAHQSQRRKRKKTPGPHSHLNDLYAQLHAFQCTSRERITTSSVGRPIFAAAEPSPARLQPRCACKPCGPAENLFICASGSTGKLPAPALHPKLHAFNQHRPIAAPRPSQRLLRHAVQRHRISRIHRNPRHPPASRPRRSGSSPHSSSSLAGRTTKIIGSSNCDANSSSLRHTLLAISSPRT